MQIPRPPPPVSTRQRRRRLLVARLVGVGLLLGAGVALLLWSS